MAKLHRMYAAIVLLVVGTSQIAYASGNLAALLAPVLNNTATFIDPPSTESASREFTSAENKIPELPKATTSSEELTTEDANELLIPPASVNASIAQMDTNSTTKRKGQITIR